MEGVEPYVYTCSANRQTIGVGHVLLKSELESGIIIINGESVEWIKGLTTEQIDGLQRADLAIAENAVNNFIHNPENLTDNQFTAMVSFAFNVGVNGFATSSVVSAINRGEFELVPDFMRLWIKKTIKQVQPDGTIKNVKVKDKGLVNRREAEIRLWNKP